MDANEVLHVIQEMCTKQGGTPVSIDSLTTQLQLSRANLFAFLVDLSLAGSIDLSSNTVSPSTIKV